MIAKGKYWYEKLGVSQLSDNQRVSICSNEFVMRNGILRQQSQYTQNQDQTKSSFSFKWDKRETYESDSVQTSGRNWLRERYLSGDPEKLFALVPEGAKVLDAGCGSGYSALLFFGDYINQLKYLGVDISDAVDVARERFSEKNISGEFIQSDLTTLPFNEPTFDVICSEGVLHHTDSTVESLRRLEKLLLPGGRLMIYIYRKKGALREYSDDYIRRYIADMDDEKAWEELLPLTKLGKTLGNLNQRVNVPEAIPFLGIPRGEIDIQRLFYWYIFKAYYKQDWTEDEMNHVNFDWYRPKNCHRHTEDELVEWCSDLSLNIEHTDVQPSGITLVARKN